MGSYCPLFNRKSFRYAVSPLSSWQSYCFFISLYLRDNPIPPRHPHIRTGVESCIRMLGQMSDSSIWPATPKVYYSHPTHISSVPWRTITFKIMSSWTKSSLLFSISFSTLFSATLNICSSLNVSDQVSNQYERTYDYAFVYIYLYVYWLQAEGQGIPVLLTAWMCPFEKNYSIISSKIPLTFTDSKHY